MSTIIGDDQLICGSPDLGKAVKLLPRKTYVNTTALAKCLCPLTILC